MKKLLPIILLIPGLPSVAGTTDSAYFPCRSCHGDSGWGSAPIHAPPLAGQSADYLERQLRAFRSGARGAHPQDTWGKQMALMAANLPEEQLGPLANHISSMPAWPAGPENTPPDPLAAQQFSLCAGCHGTSGEGNPASKAPRISGMDRVYLATQLRNFRDGIRGAQENDPTGQVMRAAIAPGMDDASIDNLARYIEGM